MAKQYNNSVVDTSWTGVLRKHVSRRLLAIGVGMAVAAIVTQAPTNVSAVQGILP